MTPEATTPPLLQIEDLRVTFATPDGAVHALRGVDLTVHDGEVLGIVGESGSGKSVMMLAVMGLLPRRTTIEGSIRFRGDELLGRRERDLRTLRGSKLAMVFQDPMTSLNPVQRVGRQVAEAYRVHNDASKRDAAQRATALLDLVGIPDASRRAREYPHEYSGGMRQRAMIAMAIANDPDLLIADEPTTALDVTVQAQVLETLVRVQEQLHTSIVLITHDLGVVARMADRVLVMYAGDAVEQGTVDDIFERPRHPYTVGLLRSLPRLDDTGARTLVPIPGTPPSLLHPPPGCPFHPRCPMVQDRCRHDRTALHDIGEGAHHSACHFADEVTIEVVP